jgi:putative transcriptional regulator
MSEQSTNETELVRARLLPDGTVVQIMPDGSLQPMKSRTDYARVAAMTEEEAEANARSDPDNPPMTDEELARFRRVPDPKKIRQRLGMTQIEFAGEFEIPLGTLRDWEQRVREPDSAARSYLRVIDANPEAVRTALRASYAKQKTEPDPTPVRGD